MTVWGRLGLCGTLAMCASAIGGANGYPGGPLFLESTSTVGAKPYDVAISDLNGDGNLDLAAANVSFDSVAVLLNQSPDAPPPARVTSTATA